MSPLQKASKLGEMADQLDRACSMLTAAELATEAIADQRVGAALYVLLSEIAEKVASQAAAMRASR